MVVGNRTPGVSDICYVSPLVSHWQLQSISAALPWKNRIAHCVVSSVPAFLLLFFPSFCSPATAQFQLAYLLSHETYSSNFCRHFFGTCSPSMTTATLGRLEKSQWLLMPLEVREVCAWFCKGQDPSQSVCFPRKRIARINTALSPPFFFFLCAGMDVHIQPPRPPAAAVFVCVHPLPWFPGAAVTL